MAFINGLLLSWLPDEQTNRKIKFNQMRELSFRVLRILKWQQDAGTSANLGLHEPNKS